MCTRCLPFARHWPSRSCRPGGLHLCKILAINFSIKLRGLRSPGPAQWHTVNMSNLLAITHGPPKERVSERDRRTGGRETDRHCDSPIDGPKKNDIKARRYMAHLHIGSCICINRTAAGFGGGFGGCRLKACQFTVFIPHGVASGMRAGRHVAS